MSHELQGWVEQSSGTADVSLSADSVLFSVGSDGNSAAQLRTTEYNGTPIASLSALSYETFVEQDGSGGQAVYIIMNVDLDGDPATTGDTDLLFFEPVYQSAAFFPSNPQGPLVTGTWQNWDALNGGWWSVNGTGGATPGTGVKSLSTIFFSFPDATIGYTAAGALRLVAGFGAGAWDNFVGRADTVTVAVGGDSTTFEFDATTDGTDGDDVIDGTPEHDNLNGLEGNDTLNGLGANDRLDGGPGDDIANGGEGNDVILHDGGGNDTANGGPGRDVIYFGAAFTEDDAVDGGGDSDIVILQGDYGAGVSVGSIRNLGMLGSISLFSSANTSYGGDTPGPNSYNLVATDDNVAAGETLKINGSSLLSGENLTFDGSAEQDGNFWLYGGQGTDTLTGGARGDQFVFLHDGRFGPGDTVSGGGGYDVVSLRGDYDLDLTAGFAADTFDGIESIALLSATDTTYGGGGDGEFDYAILWNDDLLGAGTLTVNGSRLTADEEMEFDGSAESTGSFRLFGGAGVDALRGGSGNDLIYGGLSPDILHGGGGNDVFRYQSVAESTSAGRDGIQDFNAGDRIDVSRIDAIPTTPEVDDAFAFIGDAAFSGQAGELRAESIGIQTWIVQADIDGDMVADLEIIVVTPDSHMITAADFML